MIVGSMSRYSASPAHTPPNILSEFVVNGEEMPKEVLNYRLFKRWAKKEGKRL